MAETRIAILTPAAGYQDHWAAPLAAMTTLLSARGCTVATPRWTDPVDALSGHDLILPLFAWGYQREPERWFVALDAWEAAGLPLWHDPALLRWNSDKGYLAELAARGVATVPTIDAERLDEAALNHARAAFGSDDLVVKPPVSGGADDTWRLAPDIPLPLSATGRRMLIQPLMPGILGEGETSLLLFDGRFSHALRKVPAAGDFRVQEQFGGRETPVEPEPDLIALAEAAVAAVPMPTRYARVDILRDGTGIPRLIELELIEPALFLNLSPDGGARFADAVLASAGA